MDFTKNLFSSWTEVRNGAFASSDPSPIKLIARRMAVDVYDFFGTDLEKKKAAEIYLFDFEATNEDMYTFDFICKTLGINQKKFCNALPNIPENIKRLAKFGLQNDRKAIEMVSEIRKFITLGDKYKPPEKKKSRQRKRKAVTK